MGKPLGMGAVKLQATLYLTDRVLRYGSLFHHGDWQAGLEAAGESLADRRILEARIKEFERHILEVLKLDGACEHLYQVKRIAMLLKMMEWPGFRPVPPERGRGTPNNSVVVEDGRERPNTRYMLIELPGAPARTRNEYRTRPVLPDPCAFDPQLSTLAEPPAGDPAAAGVAGAAVTAPARSGEPSLLGRGRPGGRGARARGNVGVQREGAREQKKKEWVTLLERVDGGKATVQTADGQSVPCTNFPPYPEGRAGMECRAEVVRQGGKATRARFKGWA